MRLRESLLRGDNLDLDTTNCDLLSPSLLNCDESVDAKGESGHNGLFLNLYSIYLSSSDTRVHRNSCEYRAIEIIIVFLSSERRDRYLEWQFQ
jgi:hypothetical protein